MDINRFTKQSPGRLVEVSHPIRDHAFVPDPLPPRWEFPSRLWPLLVSARERLAELNGISRALPNPELLLTPLQRREALASSTLEGTYATPEQVLLFELRDETEREEREPAPWREVFNYRTALREGHNFLQDGPLSQFLIRRLHEWLMEGVWGQAGRPGAYRDSQVYIGSDRRFIPPPVDFLEDCLTAIEETLQAGPGEVDPLVYCYLVHYQFETIHPFTDGNGRVGRLLLALMTARECNLAMPWLYMSSFFEKHKDEYVDRLFSVNRKGDWTSWVEFCLRGTEEQAADSIRRSDRLKELHEEMQLRASSGSGRLHRIVDYLFYSPVVTAPYLQKVLDVSPPTARADIERLVNLGILKRSGEQKHPMVFYAPAIWEIVFETLD